MTIHTADVVTAVAQKAFALSTLLKGAARVGASASAGSLIPSGAPPALQARFLKTQRTRFSPQP